MRSVKSLNDNSLFVTVTSLNLVSLLSNRSTEDPRYNDSACYQSCCKIEYAVIKKLDTRLKHE